MWRLWTSSYFFYEFPVHDLAEHGFRTDPLLGDVLRVLETKLLTDLKWKARLEVKGGVYLMGEQRLAAPNTY